MKSQKFANKKVFTSIEMARRLKQNNICNNIFGGSNQHIQLIQRSTEILKLLIQERMLQQEDIDIIWSATKGD